MTSSNDDSRIRFMVRAFKSAGHVPERILFWGSSIDPLCELVMASYPDANIETLEDLKGEKDKLDTRKKYDTIISLNALNHIEQLDDALTTIHKLIKKDGGLFYLEEPDNLFYSNGIEGYREQSLKSIGKKWHLGRVSWEKKLKEAGFELVKRYRGLRPNWQFVWLLK